MTGRQGFFKGWAGRACEPRTLEWEVDKDSSWLEWGGSGSTKKLGVISRQ